MASDIAKLDTARPDSTKKVKNAKAYDWKKAAADYSFAGSLISANKDLQDFFQEIATEIKKTGYPPTDQTFNRIANKYKWFQDNDSNKQAAALAQSNPATKADFERSVAKHASDIKAVADNVGLELTPDALHSLALDARINGWSNAEINDHLQPMLQAVAGNKDLTGNAGDYQTQLGDWAAQNGLDIPKETINRMVTQGAFGKQSIQDMQSELRKTYLAGSYPAWADKINQGVDPSVLAAPYMGSASKLLELGDSNSISISDPLIKQAMQATGADGKPVQMPLYQFEAMVRKDPRWQKTDNAYATYASVARNILSTFGFGG